MPLAAFPVPQKFVAQYGRGRDYFPEPIEFAVPLLCAVRIQNEPTLFYYIYDVSDEWENWKLAMPVSSDNHVFCHSDALDAKGKPVTASRKTANGYNWCTIAELRRRISSFWHQSIVLTTSSTWMPMECADPFNLLGFTCLPTIRSVDIAALPEWQMYNFDALAIATVKPVFVSAPFDTTTIKYMELPTAFSDCTMSDEASINHEESVEVAFDISKDPQPLLLSDVKRAPCISYIRDYLRSQLKSHRATGLKIVDITEVYNMNAENVAYLCTLQNIGKPLWIAEHLLDCLEINDLVAYRKYQVQLSLFQKRLDELVAKDFDEI